MITGNVKEYSLINQAELQNIVVTRPSEVSGLHNGKQARRQSEETRSSISKYCHRESYTSRATRRDLGLATVDSGEEEVSGSKENGKHWNPEHKGT